MHLPPVPIRDAGQEDREAFGALWEACLAEQGVPCDPARTEATWALLLDPGWALGLRVAVTGGGIAGLAVHSAQPNTWTGGVDGCLDTLFVAAGHRGAGIGRALVEDLLALGRTRGWRTVVWHVRAENGPARALYDRWARPDGYVRYRTGTLGPSGGGSGTQAFAKRRSRRSQSRSGRTRNP